MELVDYRIEGYKGWAEPTEVELAPLTILVGSNNSGKSALAQAIQLMAGGLAPPQEANAEPLPLESGGIRHADSFEDLLTGRKAHGRMRLAANFSGDGRKFSLSATVQNVLAPSRTSVRQITDWFLRSGTDSILLAQTALQEGSPYRVSVSGGEPFLKPIRWRGLLPMESGHLPAWCATAAEALRAWGRGVRHLKSPRRLRPSPFTLPDESSRHLGALGQDTPLALASNDELRKSVRQWYREAFGVGIDVVAQGRYLDLVASTAAGYGNVRLAHSGQGLSHVLPVVVTAMTAQQAGPGVDIIEHPEAELHPASHAHITELLLKSIVGPTRPLVIETHSPMVLLRARRWIAEGRLPPEHVVIYWIRTEPPRRSIQRQIRIDRNGDVDGWPVGVFVEDYEEIMAILRATRPKG